MQDPEDELINILDRCGVNFTSSLPCEKVKGLLNKIERIGIHVPLTREEEGVGISAGAALAGKRPVMVVQSSGLGNMINALLSLTAFYSLPLAIFISRRGVYKEKIAAQIPMGRALPGILKASGIKYTILKKKEDIKNAEKPLKEVYRRGKIHAFLMHPSLWEGCTEEDAVFGEGKGMERSPRMVDFRWKRIKPSLVRYEILKIIAPYIEGKAVVSNLGFPSKELYHILPQMSNFYMLGSMGMATPIGLGIALSSPKEVVVIDGDGSLLMNPGTLATVALKAPRNLCIVAVDNGSYGSTGGQPTHTRYVTDLSAVAYGFGMRNISCASDEKGIKAAFKKKKSGPAFIHIIAKAGNRRLPDVPLSPGAIKRQVMEAICPDA